jgi:carboxyl-terminal processing protease
LTLTIGKFYRITGGSTQHKGVLPDIALPSSVDPTLIGESSRGGALPWDQIDPTRYRANAPLDSAIAYLTQNESTRMREDADARYLQADVQALATQRNQRAVSLNLAVRTAEREKQRKEQLARENTRRAAQGLTPLASLDKAKPDEFPDVLLGQATQIMADYVRLGRPDKTLAASTVRPN